MKRARDLKMVVSPHSGLLIPDHVATKMGMGCDLCDDHELIPISPDWQITPIIAKFREKHRGHGDLDSLEFRGDRLFVTGKIPGLK